MSPKQQRFVSEYLIDLNATQAAIRAGYSAKTAKSIGQETLTKPDVQAALQQAIAAREKRAGVTQDRVLAEVANIAFASITDIVTWGMKVVAFGFDADGKALPAEQLGDAVMVRYAHAPFLEARNSDDLPDHVRAAVSEVALTKDGLKVKMHGKTEALTLAGRHLGMWKDKLEVDVAADVAAMLAAARKRRGST